MCNPRRVHVTASRELLEAWQHEVQRVITLSGDVNAEVRIREVLDASIGAPTLAVLERALSEANGWHRDGDTFTYPLDGGHVAYHADTQELEIVASAADEVSVEIASTEVVHGELAETVDITGTGIFYDDGWGDITADDAHAEAVRDVEIQLAARRRQLIDAAQAAAEAAHGDTVAATAAAEAQAQLERRRAARAEELRIEASGRLTAVGIQGRNVFHQALALAYRDAILAYAHARGAEGVTCTDHDGVLEIQFEMSV
jgi:hypothetical protein